MFKIIVCALIVGKNCFEIAFKDQPVFQSFIQLPDAPEPLAQNGFSKLLASIGAGERKMNADCGGQGTQCVLN